jgi:predicted DCC family thiol-disulfide oxidoreductase YuxK
MKIKKKAIILFDGDCKLCNGSVRFISNRDHGGYFTYIPIKSEEAKKLIDKYKMDETELDSVLLIRNGRILTQSTAALTIVRYFSGIWPLLYVFMIVPKFIRDNMYKLIAIKRHKWFDQININEQKNE